jgi:DNA-binding IclR family transcriptional regulator
VPRPAPQTDRLIALFRLLAARPQQGCSMAEISRRIGVNRANLYPMIATLLEAGWLVHDPETKLYGLGPALIGLGEAASTGYPALAGLRPAAVALSDEYRASSAVFTRSDRTVTLAELVWDVRKGAAPMRLGQAFPLRAPFGAGFVAWAGEDEVDDWLAASDLPRAQLLEALEAIRRRGFVVEADWRPDDQVWAIVERIREGLRDEDWLSDRAFLSDRAVEALIEDMSRREDSLVRDLDPCRLYRISSIGAPIFDPRGEVTTFLVLFGFPGPMSGRDVEKLGRHICREVERVTGHNESRKPRVGRIVSR